MAKRVLVVVDDVPCAKTVQSILRESGAAAFSVEWLRSCALAIARLAQEFVCGTRPIEPVDAIIVDLALADSSGIETFDRLFQAAPRTPILVLCADRDAGIGMGAIRRGAQDFILKERLDGYSLPKAVHGMIERSLAARALFEHKEQAQITLDSISDGVISTDVDGRVTYLNGIAQALTGWTVDEAVGRALEDVLHIVDGSAQVVAQHPMAQAIRQNAAASLAPNCLLIRRDGREFPIEDSAAPIHDGTGRVTGAVMVFRDVSEPRALAARMEYQARHDSLTDLPNRASMHEQLVKAAALAQRSHLMLAVLFLDIDRFKYVNDSLGHDIGDRLLQSVARRLSCCVRDSDTVSRIGGDEFAVLLAQLTHAQDAAVCADKILRQLRAAHHLGDHELHVTVSIGIATSPEDGVDARSLLKSADLAMYHAKSRGRNNYQFFRAEMNTHLQARRSMEKDLQLALERGEFTLLFQPTVALATRYVTGVEALLRWHHPERGLLVPEQFLPLAEECGLIVPIGRWVLDAACREASSWRQACLSPMRIAVNVSALELRDKNFAAGVETALGSSGIEPGSLVLELTETTMVRDTESTARVLNSLKEIGVELALDDFGTGFSSLSHLQRFPIDVLKIDQSFLWNLTAGSDDASIVGAVIGMADSLRMRVIAEGVENPTQLAVLEEQSCPEAQGYFFSRPLGAAALVEFMRHAQSPGSVQPGIG